MKTQLLDSSMPIQAPVGVSWKLIAEGVALTDKVLPPYSNLHITALAAAVKITVDGLDAIVIPIGQSMIINTGLGDPTDNKKVKVTTSAACNVSIAIDKPLDRSQPVLEVE